MVLLLGLLQGNPPVGNVPAGVKGMVVGHSSWPHEVAPSLQEQKNAKDAGSSINKYGPFFWPGADCLGMSAYDLLDRFSRQHRKG